MERLDLRESEHDMTLNITSLEEEFTNLQFPTKRESNLKILANLSKDMITAVSNFYTFDFSKNFSNIFLFAITVRDSMGVQNPHHGLIKRISGSPKIKDFLRTYFVDFLITGNSLFGEPKTEMDFDELKFFICFKKGKEDIIDENE
jgi:hypothetical protein